MTTPAFRWDAADVLPILAIATGIFPREELLALGPEHGISCCTDLLRNA